MKVKFLEYGVVWNLMDCIECKKLLLSYERILKCKEFYELENILHSLINEYNIDPCKLFSFLNLNNEIIYNKNTFSI